MIRKRILQVCFVILVVSLVIMVIHSIVSDGKVEASNFIPFIGIVPIMIALIGKDNDKNDK